MNIRQTPLMIEKGQGIAQLLIVPIETPAVAEVPIESLFPVKSGRGAGGGIHNK